MSSDDNNVLNEEFTLDPVENVDAQSHPMSTVKKTRKRKGVYIKRLESDNLQLKHDIQEFLNKISIIESQNTVLLQQL